MMLERTLTNSEHTRSLASQHLADEARAMSGKPHDLLLWGLWGRPSQPA